MKKCVIVPCYNVESHIRSVIIAVPDFIDDIIVIDDKSQDDLNKAKRNAHKINRKGNEIWIENIHYGSAVSPIRYSFYLQRFG